MAQHHAALPAGTLLAEFRLDSVLGQGGFGITYLAHDTALDRKVAVKEYLPVELATRIDGATVTPLTSGHVDTYGWGLARFLDEARTLARFRHPNIVRVLRVVEQNGTAYMVMEHEDGRSLDDAVKFRKVEGEAALRAVLAPLLDGLAHVHEAGFVHRDIKPPNIMVRADGSPVLIDFGSARQSLGAETRTMTALVTEGYAPFEQYNATKDDDRQGPWTDIYALAATLYRAVTGKSPVSALVRANSLLDGKPDPLIPAAVAAPSGYSPAFLRAIDRALAFRATDRPQSVAAWRAMLDGTGAVADDATVLRAPPAPAPAAPGRRAAPAPAAKETASSGGRGMLVAAVLALAAIGAGGGWWFAQQGSTPATANGAPPPSSAAGTQADTSAPAAGTTPGAVASASPAAASTASSGGADAPAAPAAAGAAAGSAPAASSPVAVTDQPGAAPTTTGSAAAPSASTGAGATTPAAGVASSDGAGSAADTAAALVGAAVTTGAAALASADGGASRPMAGTTPGSGAASNPGSAPAIDAATRTAASDTITAAATGTTAGADATTGTTAAPAATAGDAAAGASAGTDATTGTAAATDTSATTTGDPTAGVAAAATAATTPGVSGPAPPPRGAATAGDGSAAGDALAAAEAAVRAGRLTPPAADSAAELYGRALALDPGNRAADAGLAAVASRLLAEAGGALDAGRTDDAASLVDRAEGVRPAAEGIAAIRERIAAARAAAERQADETAARQAAIERRVAAGDAALAALRLTSPADDNAVLHYRAVLEQVPDEPRALAGLQRVVDRYVELADRALAGGDPDKASGYLDRAEGVDSSAPALAAARERVSAERDRSAAAAGAETQAAGAEQQGVAAEQAAAPAAAAADAPAVAALSPDAPFRDPLSGGGEGPPMVMVSGGSTTLGSPPSEPGREIDEQPVTLAVAERYAIGVTEVTFEDFDRYTSATGQPPLPDLGWGRGRQPVVGVTWDEAVAYTRWLSAATGQRYRLPSEAEWEHAARAGTATAWWWGTAGNGGKAVCNGCGSPFDGRRPAPAGSFPVNAFGLADTAGNVWEWTCSAWSPALGEAARRCSTSTDTPRVLRGGSFLQSPAHVRSANRSHRLPTERMTTAGFRVLREF